MDTVTSNTTISNIALSGQQDFRPRLLKKFAIRRTILILLVLLLSALLISCKPEVRLRPFGYMHLGKLIDFASPETFLERDRLIVRHDEGGLSVMSTLCTRDLTPLELQTNEAGQKIWVSKYSESKYALDGRVLQGPAKANLPYYLLQIDRNTYDGPRDGLYVQIGREVPLEWRLAIN